MRWINRFLTVAAALVCAAAVAAVFGAWRGGSGRSAHTVADIVVNLTGTPVREHCTTCHPGGARAVPHAGVERLAHPDIGIHDPEDLGCTGCHLGEGMALDTVVSHGRVGNRSRQVLSGEDVQATCYRCHDLAPLPGAERAWNGYRLFRDLACGVCHHLAAGGHGGRYGPDLRDVGTYLSLAELAVAVADPRSEPDTSTMPRYPLSEADVVDLGYFLKSRVANPAHSTPMQRRAAERRHGSFAGADGAGRPPTGEELFGSLRCQACHRLGKEGNWIGPDLTYIGDLRDTTYLREFLTAPTRVIPGARMPRIPMSVSAVEALAGFLAATAPGVMENASAKHLYMALCQPCHAADGRGEGVIEPNLAHFPRAFRDNAEFFQRAADRRLVQSIKAGVPGTSMPSYGRLLTDAQADAVLDLVFQSFVRVARGDKASLDPLPAKPRVPPPEREVSRAYDSLCLRCHGRTGNGKGPEYTQYLPRPRDLTNRPYVEALDDERLARAVFDGVAGTAMAGFRGTLSPELIWGLVTTVRRFSEDTDE